MNHLQFPKEYASNILLCPTKLDINKALAKTFKVPDLN